MFFNDCTALATANKGNIVEVYKNIRKVLNTHGMCLASKWLTQFVFHHQSG